MSYVLIFIFSMISLPSKTHAQIFNRLDSKLFQIFGSLEVCRDFGDSCLLQIVDNNKKKIAEIKNVQGTHYHFVELRDHFVFWIVRSGDPNRNSDWTDELWVLDLLSGKRERIAATQGLDFRASADGLSVSYLKGNELHIVDRKTKAEIKVAGQGDGDAKEGFELVGWSSDGKKFWFGTACNCPESWDKLAVYENSKVRWFSYEGSHEGFLDPDRGWLIRTDTPFPFDSAGREEFERKKTTTHLEVIEVHTGKKAQIASGVSAYFKPSWLEPDVLKYSLNGKSMKTNAKEIQLKLK